MKNNPILHLYMKRMVFLNNLTEVKIDYDKDERLCLFLYGFGSDVSLRITGYTQKLIEMNSDYKNYVEKNITLYLRDEMNSCNDVWITTVREKINELVDEVRASRAS